MIEQTGETYQSSTYAKALAVSDPKAGKSTYLIAGALGVLPWQTRGGVVDRPENLHVITFDANALGGVNKFLIDTCKAPKEALKYRVYNMQDDLNKIAKSTSDWDFTFYNTIVSTLQKISQRVAGVPMVLISSITGLAAGVQRGLAGPPGGKKGNGMDKAKWPAFANQMSELRFMAQQDLWHCIWEAHLRRKENDAGQVEESIQVPGQSGDNFAYNVEQVFKIRRQYGAKHPNTNCDKVYLDCRPTLTFVANGRNFTELLDAQEPDPAVAFQKLGLKVGHWGAKSAAPKVLKPTATR